MLRLSAYGVLCICIGFDDPFLCVLYLLIVLIAHYTSYSAREGHCTPFSYRFLSINDLYLLYIFGIMEYNSVILGVTGITP